MGRTALLPRGPTAPAPLPGSASPPPAPPPAPPRGPDGVSRRVRRNRSGAAMLLVVLAAVAWLANQGGGSPSAAGGGQPAHHHPGATNPRLGWDWEGNGRTETFAFGGDVNFPTGSILGDRLAARPVSALGSGVPQLLAHANLSMVNFESALTDGSCPDLAPKQYNFWAPPSAVNAFRGAHVSLVTEANNHGEDCGVSGLRTALSVRARTKYPIIGIGRDAAAAYTPYQATVNGQRVGIIGATQVIDSDLRAAWTATASRPGLASAYEVNALVAAVQRARRIDDTVIVFLHWGVQLDACPDAIQEPLATALVRAGADIVIGSHAHVLLGAGFKGTALVDYGLGNFAFYNDPAPTNYSGSLVVTVTGRHVDGYTWRPAIIENELPIPVAGPAKRQVLSRWESARACTDLTLHPTHARSSATSETVPLAPQLAAPLSIG